MGRRILLRLDENIHTGTRAMLEAGMGEWAIGLGEENA